MQAAGESMGFELMGDLWAFLLERKAWWLVPLIVLIVVVGALVLLAQSSVISAFVYTLF